MLLVNISIQATTRYLASGTSDQTTAFQSLVDLSVTGDVIIIQSGDHYLLGTVIVNKSGISLSGVTGNAIRKTGTVSCIDLTGSNNTIDNIYIDGGGLAEPCMRVYGNYNTITNSTFRNSGNSGLLINSCNHNTISGCFAYYNYMVGISQWAHSDATISNCQMYENGAEGLTIDGGTHNNVVYGNWIHKNNLSHRGVGGIGIDESDGSQIYNNTIDYNGYDGIKFQNNLCCGDDGAQIYNNENISYNEWCAVKFRLVQPVTNFGWWGNTCVGNAGGEQCTTYSDLSYETALRVEVESQNLEVKLYPNPASTQITLENIADFSSAQIFNAFGQKVCDSKLNQSTQYISIGTLVNGFYIIRLTSDLGTSVNKQFVKE